MIIDLFPRFGCLPANYVLIVVSPNLVVHALIDLTHQAHNMGAARTTQEVHSD